MPRLSPPSLIHKTLLLIFAAIVFGPLAALFTGLFKALAAGNFSLLSLALPTGRRLVLLANSLSLAFLVAVSAMLIGVLVALYLWRFKSGVGRYLRWLIILLVSLPPYIHALSWMSVLGRLKIMPAEGFWVSWWVELMAYLPLAVGLSLFGLDAVEPVLIEAGRLARPDIETLKKIILPLAFPAISACAGLLFLLSLMDFSIPSLFSINVYALEIFAEYSATNDPIRALLLGAPLLALAVIVIMFVQRSIRSAALTIGRPAGREPAFLIFPEWLNWLQKSALMIIIIQILVPLISLIASAGSLKSVAQSALQAKNEITFSFWLSITAGLLCLAPACAMAEELTDRGTGNYWWFLVVLALVIPGSLVGAGLILLPVGVWLPVIAYLSRFLPLAALVILAKLRRTDPLLVEASRVHQPDNFSGWWRVRLPLLGPGLWAAGCLVFIFSLGELAATIMVTPPGYNTLAVRIYNYLHYGASAQVAGLCLVMAAIFLGTGALMLLIFSSGGRLIKLGAR